MKNIDTFWIRKARRYVGAWQRSYNLSMNDADRIVHALAHALKKSNEDGKRAGKNAAKQSLNG